MLTTYTVAIQEEDGGPTAKSTQDLEEALDWFTNAVDDVMDQDGHVIFATLAVNGVITGMIRAGGLAPEGGEVINLRQVA